MSQVCKPAGCVDAIRFALVDDCTDIPLAGPSNGYIATCIRNVEWTSNIEEGDETVLETDCGKKCWQTKQCDELRNYTLTFQLLNPDYELTSLIEGTAATLLEDAGENIGVMHREGFPCHPWMSVELFEKIPDEDCSTGHLYRRIVFPKIRFQTANFEKEAPFRVVSFTGMTSPAQLYAWGDGPFGDSPFDFVGVGIDVTAPYFEFYDDSITQPLTGNCGLIEVPFDEEDLQNVIQISDADSPYQVQPGDELILVDACDATVDVVLPANHVLDDQITIKRVCCPGGFAVTVSTADADDIDGSPTYVLNTDCEAVTVLSDASNWWSI